MADEKPEALESAADSKTQAVKSGSTKKNRTRSTSSTRSSKASSKQKSVKKPLTANSGTPRNLGRVFRLLVIVFLVGGLAFTSWYFYQKFDAEFQSKTAQLELLNYQSAELTQIIIDTQQGQQNIENTLSSFIGDQQRQMQALADRIRSTEGARDGDWLLAEAQYLVRLADQRLLVSRDTDSAVDLLSGADELLRELAYPEMVPVREALIADISALRAVPSVDYQGIYFQITTMGQAIDGLALASIEGIENWDSPQSELPPDNRVGIWSSAVAAIRSSLDQLIIVRKAEGSAEWIVDAEGELALRAQMDLLVMQSLSALLSGDQQIYQSALQTVADLLQNNFQSTAQRNTLVTELRSFSVQPIQSEVPDISSSLRAMQQGAQVMRRIDQGE